LDDAARLGQAVDTAVTAAVPEIEDLQVATAPGGMVVISGVVRSEGARERAEAVARRVEGVRELIGSLTVADDRPGTGLHGDSSSG
jgi:osmotically-inducible protein OsmY